MPASLHGSEQYIKQFYTTEVVADRPTSWEIALHTAPPGTGDDAEVVGTTYLRQELAFTATAKTAYFEAENVADVIFPALDVGEAYTVTHYTIRDKVSGECLSIGQLPVPLPLVEGGIVSFPATFIKIRGV